MNLRHRASIALAVCAMAAAPSLAQDDLIPVTNTMGGNQPVGHPVGYPPQGGYESRAIGSPFDTLSGLYKPDAPVFFLGGPPKQVMDDVNFAPGPWAAAATRLVSRIGLGLGNIGTADESFTLRVRVYQSSDVDYTRYDNGAMVGLPMISGAAVPLADFILTTPSIFSNFGDNYFFDLSGLPGGGVSLNAHQVSYWQLQYIVSPTDTTQSTSTSPTFIVVSNNYLDPACYANPAFPGFSLPSYGRDRNNDGVLLGNPAPAGNPVEHNVIESPAGRYLGVGLRLFGDIIASPPAAENRGSLADGVSSDVDAVPANGTKWYQFSLAGAARDNAGAAGQFVDIDTEGSGVDFSLALYHADGRLIWADDDSGSGSNAQLTFGMGRRAAVGDGKQYDGRHFDGTGPSPIPGLNAGTYYLAVANNGASFSDAFQIGLCTSPGGAVTVNFNTNTNGSALAASVPPITDFDAGQLVFPGAPAGPFALDAYQVAWVRFETCEDAVDPANYLDLDMASTDALYTELMVFDSSGNMVARDLDSGPGLLSQLSFGQTAPSRPPTGDGSGLPFAGQNGTLPAGVYYAATSYEPTGQSPSASTNGRWHVRGYRLDSGFSFDIAMLVSWASCPATCGSADFDGDGDTGTDLDIEAFFSCLGGNCCGTCGSADFDGDGDTGTDLDIEAFFRVLGGGTC